MHYEINVTLNGRPFFTTNPRSLLTEAKAAQVYKELLHRFPAAEGFRVRVVHVAVKCTIVTSEFETA